MDVTLQKSDLVRALTIANSVVEKRSTMPVLSNVLLIAEANMLRVAATNLEATALTRVVANVETSGKTTVNAKVFAEITRELPEGEVHLKLGENRRLEIISGKSKFKMIGVNPDEFPSLPGMAVEPASKIKAGNFLEMINKTIYSVSHDETRFNLNGVCFEKHSDGTLRMVATDGHRLALINRPVGNLEFERQAIVPTKGLSEIRRVLDENPETEVAVCLEEGFFVIESGDTKISMRLIDGEFPDYTQVMPRQEGVRARIKSSDLAASLKRAALMVTDRGKCVKLEFSPGKLCLSSSSPELGESSEEIQIDYDGEPLTIGFNARYLMEFSASLGEDQEMTLELNGELGPAKLYASSDESYCGVVMPMRLS